MATLENALRSAANTAIAATFTASSTCSTLVLEDSGGTPIALLIFSSSAWGDPTNGVCSAAAVTSDTDADGGTADHICMYNSTGTKLMTCTLGTTTASDFVISNLVIGSADTIACSSIVMTVPAS